MRIGWPQSQRPIAWCRCTTSSTARCVPGYACLMQACACMNAACTYLYHWQYQAGAGDSHTQFTPGKCTGFARGRLHGRHVHGGRPAPACCRWTGRTGPPLRFKHVLCSSNTLCTAACLKYKALSGPQVLFWDRRMRNLPCTHVSAGRASGQLNSVQTAPGGYVIYAGSGAGEVTSTLSKLEPQCLFSY